MKIETTITPRDRKLITVVGSVAIVIVCAWAGIKPLWETRQDLLSQRDAQQERVEEATNPSLTTSLQDGAARTMRQVANDTLAGYQQGALDASQANELAYSLANSYGLRVLSVEFALPAQGSYAAEPSYSTSGDDSGDSSDSGSSGSSSSSSVSSSDATVSMGQGAQAADTGDLTGIYQTNFQLALAGSRENLQNFLDSVAQDRPGMRVQQFQWTLADENGSETSTQISEPGLAWHLTVNLAVYSFDSFDSAED